MYSLTRSALLSVMLLAAPLGTGLPGGRLVQASAGEPDQVIPAEITESRPATPSSSAASVASICGALAAAAAENDLLSISMPG